MKKIAAGIPLVLSIAAVCLLTVFPAFTQEKTAPAVTAPAETRGIDPQADKLLKQMSDYLASLKQFSVETESTHEIVLKTGQKVQYCDAGDVFVRRPDKLKADRKSRLADLSLYYDGKNLTVYGKRKNLYASTEAPSSLDKAIDYARDDLGLIAPGADLLYSNVYDELMAGVESGFVVGENEIRGVKCNHLAFRTESLDWQIWIQDGSKPVPRRFVITSTQATGVPQYEITFNEWKTDAGFGNDIFTFTPPKDAQKIEFLKRNAPAPSGPEGGKKP